MSAGARSESHAALRPQLRRRADKASLTTWIAVLAGMIGAFMAILNIQITNASLLDIEGGIGTGVDNGAWISTSYLIGEIVVIPLTDYLSRVFSFRALHAGEHDPVPAVLDRLRLHPRSRLDDRHARPAGLCGRRPDPDGLHHGADASCRRRSSRSGSRMFALAVTFAPAIGPTIGGYLTENYGWQTIFFINAVPSAVDGRGAAVHARTPADAARAAQGGRLGRHRHHGDRALGLADRAGGRQQGRLVRLALHPAAGRRRGRVPHGLHLDRADGRRSRWSTCACSSAAISASATLANMLVGFALFGTVYILPQYLGQVQGYNAEQIGNVLAWTGLPQLLLIPLVPLLMKRFDIRYIGFVGISIFAASCFMNVTLSLDNAGDQFFLPNIVRAIGQALVLTPITAITTVGIAPKEAGAALAC